MGWARRQWIGGGWPWSNLRAVAALALDAGIRYRHGIKQDLGVGVGRCGDDLAGGAQFDQLSPIHHTDPVAQFGHDRKIVRHKQISDIEFALEFTEEPKNVLLDRNVQRRDRFVENDQPWIEHEGPCNCYALPLPA